MAENPPIRDNVEVLPPNVTPLEPGAKPADPSKRNLLKKIGSIAAVLGFGAAVTATKTKKGQEVMAAFPGASTPPNRPTIDQQKQEIEKNQPNA